MSKEAYYFSHDSNARHDPKIMKMISVYGTIGYAYYFMLIEILREQKDYKYKIDKYYCNAIALELHCEPDAIQKFITDCISEFDLFKSDKEYFWSESLNKRMLQKEEKSRIASENAQKRWGDAKAMRTHSKGNALKEKKGNKIKENKTEETIMVGEREIIIKKYFLDLLPINSIQPFIEAWVEWVDFRKEIKHSLTRSTALKQLNFLLKQPNAIECISTSIEKGWQGLFETKNSSTPQNRDFTPSPEMQRILNAAKNA